MQVWGTEQDNASLQRWKFPSVPLVWNTSPNGTSLAFCLWRPCKSESTLATNISEVRLVIFEVVAWGHSFQQVQAALKIWTSSLLGKHGLDLTQKWWLIGWWEKKKQCEQESFTEVVSEANNNIF